jgi:hypothetical protein
MTTLKQVLVQELENLNEEQLKQVNEFITFLKFRSRTFTLNIGRDRLASLYSELAEEDRKLAEEGMDEYAELLRQEDSQ